MRTYQPLVSLWRTFGLIGLQVGMLTFHQQLQPFSSQTAVTRLCKAALCICLSFPPAWLFLGISTNHAVVRLVSYSLDFRVLNFFRCALKRHLFENRIKLNTLSFSSDPSKRWAAMKSIIFTCPYSKFDNDLKRWSTRVDAPVRHLTHSTRCHWLRSFVYKTDVHKLLSFPGFLRHI